MLSFHARSSGGRTCDGLSRRNFLRLGALSVGSLTLADLMRLRGEGAVHSSARGKAVIMVYTPQNVLATLYRVLGIGPQTTINDLQGRPRYLLDDMRPIAELV